MSAWVWALLALIGILAWGAGAFIAVESDTDWGFPAYLVGSFAIAVAVCVFLGVSDSEKHKNDVCVQSHQATSYIKSGDVLVPYTYTTCDRYVPKEQ